jgi:hypothetical protein
MKTIQQFISNLFIGSAVVLTFDTQAFSQTWMQTSAPNRDWQSVASSADGTKLVGVIGQNAGGIYTSTNSGIIWAHQTNAPTPIDGWQSVASSADGAKLVVVAPEPGLICDSTNSGVAWTFTSAPTNYWLCVASSADGSKLVAGAYPYQYGANSGGGIYTSTNSGTTWTLETNAPMKNYWISVASSADGNKLVAVADLDTNGNLGGIYTSTDSGVTWTQTSAPTNSWSSVASSVDGCKLVAVATMSGFFPGNGGNIYTSTNAGATWISNNVPVDNWQSVASSADGTKLIAVTWFSNGGIYTSTNSGAGWIQFTNIPNAWWASVASSADGCKLALAGYEANYNPGSIYISQSIPTPALGIASSSTNVALSWIVPSTNFVMQQSSDLASWSNVTNAPVLNLTNLQNEVILSPSNSSGFYRLKTP